MNGATASSPDRASVGRICGQINHAYRGLKLYRSDHPTARAGLETLVESLTSYVGEKGLLTLRVEENLLIYEDQVVYSCEESRDSVPFLLFRDGIRSISFLSGIGASEVEAFVYCLAHIDDLAESEHDMSTALWEYELEHLEYTVVNPFLGDVEERERVINNLRDTVIGRLDELALPTLETGASAEDLWQLERTGLGVESTTLTEEEIQESEKAVAQPTAALREFALVLLELAGYGSVGPAEDDALANALALVVERCLDNGDLDTLALVMDHLLNLEAQSRYPSGSTAKLVSETATAKQLTRMILGVSQTTSAKGALADRLLGQMSGWITPRLLEILVESSNKSVRKTVLGLLHLDEGVPVRHLWPLMQDARWYVVRNAVQLATGSGDPDLVGHLERLLRHSDARVRREVMRSLDTVGGARCVSALVKALQDEDASVRILAVRSLARHGGQAHVDTVLSHIQSRDFETRSSEEIAAFLLAYAVLGREKAVETLNKLWKKRIFGARPLPVRLAAVQALGAIASPAAERALAEAGKSGEAQVQRVAARARSEGQVRARETRK